MSETESIFMSYGGDSETTDSDHESSGSSSESDLASISSHEDNNSTRGGGPGSDDEFWFGQTDDLPDSGGYTGGGISYDDLFGGDVRYDGGNGSDTESGSESGSESGYIEYTEQKADTDEQKADTDEQKADISGGGVLDDNEDLGTELGSLVSSFSL